MAYNGYNGSHRTLGEQERKRRDGYDVAMDISKARMPPSDPGGWGIEGGRIVSPRGGMTPVEAERSTTAAGETTGEMLERQKRLRPE
jgi:hypothetical protein